MKMTKAYLKKIAACQEGVDWFVKQEETDSIKVLKKLIKENHLDWANWFIVRIMAEY